MRCQCLGKYFPFASGPGVPSDWSDLAHHGHGLSGEEAMEARLSLLLRDLLARSQVGSATRRQTFHVPREQGVSLCSYS